MPKLADFSAVIFDMDGLVLETESTYCLAWQKAGQALGYTFSNDFCLAMSGLSGTVIEQRLYRQFGSHFPLQLFREISGQYWHEHVNRQGIGVKHGVSAWLNYLNNQKIPYCLATNSRLATAKLCLQLAGLANAFAIMVSRDDVVEGKPEPAIFFAAAERLQVAISDCLVLEDSYTGVVAANRAGAFTALIPSVQPVASESVQLSDIMAGDLQALFNILNTDTLAS